MHTLRRRSSDADLIGAIAGGDERAFDELYRRHLPALTGYFLRRVADRELAFDLTAETFAAVIEASDRFDRSKGAGVAWILSIAHNKLVTSYRRGRVESEARERLRLEPIAIADDDLERVEELANEGSESVILQALDQIPANRREAILGRIVDEQPYDVIAQELSCSEAVVRQRVSRGLRDLKLRMEEME